MNLKEIYNDKKKAIDAGYMEMYHMIEDEIENDEEYTLASDELNELVVDLMLSNVLGEITTFDECTQAIKEYNERQARPNIDDIEMLQRENKAMAEQFEKLGFTQAQISDIANGAI